VPLEWTQQHVKFYQSSSLDTAPKVGARVGSSRRRGVDRLGSALRGRRRPLIRPSCRARMSGALHGRRSAPRDGTVGTTPCNLNQCPVLTRGLAVICRRTSVRPSVRGCKTRTDEFFALRAYVCMYADQRAVPKSTTGMSCCRILLPVLHHNEKNYFSFPAVSVPLPSVASAVVSYVSLLVKGEWTIRGKGQGGGLGRTPFQMLASPSNVWHSPGRRLCIVASLLVTLSVPVCWQDITWDWAEEEPIEF